VDIFKLPKPTAKIDLAKLAARMQDMAGFREFVERTNRPDYLYWDKVRYKPRPEGMSAEEFWALVKFARMNSPTRARVAVRDEGGSFFTWQPLPGLDRFLHEIDMHLSGNVDRNFADDQTARQRFVSGGIMEEAIASSQLEGASTTRRIAKQMLRERRRPTNRPEQMILNNYRAMIEVEDRLRGERMSQGVLMNLHQMLVENTVDNADLGRFRREGENVVVDDRRTGVVYHIPPKAQLLGEEIERFVAYANDEYEDYAFVHPLIKAIILHFWIGYLHPFTDGNGRLARSIFYWYVLRKGYWAFSYLPLSRVIKGSPAQYRDAYVYSEQDDNDLTYFIDYNVRKIGQARREFAEYVQRKQAENRRIADLVRSEYSLNGRQVELLRHMSVRDSAPITIKTFSNTFGVSRITARKDLEGLERAGFLTSQKIGRERPFRASEKVAELFS
jgi:Fic family protein